MMCNIYSYSQCLCIFNQIKYWIDCELINNSFFFSFFLFFLLIGNRLGQLYKTLKWITDRDACGFFFCKNHNLIPLWLCKERRTLIWIQCPWSLHVSLFSFLLGREYRLLDCFILQVHGNTFGICDIHFFPTGPPRKKFLDLKKETLPCQEDS